jgi:hypothetical protein
MDRSPETQVDLLFLNHAQPVKAEDFLLMTPVIGAMAPDAGKAIEVFRRVFLRGLKTGPRSGSRARVVPVNGVVLAATFLSKFP